MCAPSGCLQGSVSILAHSLGSVLCYDILCNQPQPAVAGGGSGGGSAPGSPLLLQLHSPPQHASPLGQATLGQQQSPGSEPEAMEADLLVADSPAAALQQELARLRADNQRLQLQLEVARAEGGSGNGGGGGLPAAQQQQQPVATGSAPAAYQQPPQEPLAPAGSSPAATGCEATPAWPPLQFRWVHGWLLCVVHSFTLLNGSLWCGMLSLSLAEQTSSDQHYQLVCQLPRFLLQC